MSAILLAGFGGQGILFAGKQLVLAGMQQDKDDEADADKDAQSGKKPSASLLLQASAVQKHNEKNDHTAQKLFNAHKAPFHAAGTEAFTENLGYAQKENRQFKSKPFSVGQENEEEDQRTDQSEKGFQKEDADEGFAIAVLHGKRINSQGRIAGKQWAKTERSKIKLSYADAAKKQSAAGRKGIKEAGRAMVGKTTTGESTCQDNGKDDTSGTSEYTECAGVCCQELLFEPVFIHHGKVWITEYVEHLGTDRSQKQNERERQHKGEGTEGLLPDTQSIGQKADDYTDQQYETVVCHEKKNLLNRKD